MYRQTVPVGAIQISSLKRGKEARALAVEFKTRRSNPHWGIDLQERTSLPLGVMSISRVERNGTNAVHEYEGSFVYPSNSRRVKTVLLPSGIAPYLRVTCNERSPESAAMKAL
jgi:hypothetical protein